MEVRRFGIESFKNKEKPRRCQRGPLGVTLRELFLYWFGFRFFGRSNDWFVLAFSAGLSSCDVARALDL